MKCRAVSTVQSAVSYTSNARIADYTSRHARAWLLFVCSLVPWMRAGCGSRNSQSHPDRTAMRTAHRTRTDAPYTTHIACFEAAPAGVRVT